MADGAPSCASVLPGPEAGTRPLGACRVDLMLAGATGTGTVGTEHSPVLVPVSCAASDKRRGRVNNNIIVSGATVSGAAAAVPEAPVCLQLGSVDVRAASSLWTGP